MAKDQKKPISRAYAVKSDDGPRMKTLKPGLNHLGLLHIK